MFFLQNLAATCAEASGRALFFWALKVAVEQRVCYCALSNTPAAAFWPPFGSWGVDFLGSVFLKNLENERTNIYFCDKISQDNFDAHLMS